MPDLKLYYRAIVIKKNACYWYSDSLVDQWNRLEDPEMISHSHGHMIFDKGAKIIQWKEDSTSTNGSGSTGSYLVEECELIHSYLLLQSLSGSKNST